MRRLLFPFVGIFLLLFLVKGSIYAQDADNPPPPDSLCRVFSGIDYGGAFSSPQNYPNAKHITSVKVGSYYFPVVIWETGASWCGQSLFSFWDDMFKFWSYPDSFTSNQGQDTGRGNVCADSQGNLHFAWHQAGNPDGYEVFYTRAILDTSAGMIQYYVERPAVMISGTNGEEESFPAMTIYNDTLIMVVFNVGSVGEEHAVGYNYSTDGGDTWVGRDVAYEHGDTMYSHYILLPSIASNPNTGDMWTALGFDDDGNYANDIVALHYDAVGGNWTKEDAAISPYSGLYRHFSFPVICVDFSGTPSIVFTNCMAWMGGQPPPWYHDGILLFTRRESGGWISPVEIGIPESGPTNAVSGFPSIGISQDNEIYITCTQPESASPDTYAYAPFNVYYWKINPEMGIYDVPRTMVSEIPSSNDTLCAIFPHIVYNILSDSSGGPGIGWCQMGYEGFWGMYPPADLYYKQMHQLTEIKKDKNTRLENRNLKLRAHPNPFTQKTVIRYSSSVINDQLLMTNDLQCPALRIYDASGRLVKSFSPFALHSSLFSSVIWDGKNDAGHKVKSGVYFLKLKVAKKEMSKKVILLE